MRTIPASRRAKPVTSLLVLIGLVIWHPVAAADAPAKKTKQKPRIAAVVTAYYHNSHADVLVSRLLQGYLLNDNGKYPQLELASIYTDQVPERDKSRKLAAEHDIPICETVEEALTLGTGKLAVDGVMLVAEHGNYPESATGSIQYPKRRLFSQIVKVFRKSDRVAPVFSDKHLSDNWEDAKWIYDTAQRMKIPMMAGSSLPVLWRYPPAEVERGAKLEELVATSYHRLDTYGFHALEMVQSLVERRAGGETGVKQVQCLEGEAVWDAARRGVFDLRLLEEALTRLKERPLPEDFDVQEQSKNPQLFVIDYRDGFRASIITFDRRVVEWAVAWRRADEQVKSTLFWTQEARPYMHFTYLLKGIEKMMHTGKPTWPVERTLLTSGTLDALLISRKENHRKVDTPHLKIQYTSDWNFQQPPPPPPGRPHTSQ